MEFKISDRAKQIHADVADFMAEYIYPNEEEFYRRSINQPDDFREWKPLALIEELKVKARKRGLWNLFLPESEFGAGLTNVEYAGLCEMMGRAWFACEVFNCDAPNTGNMEVLVRYGTPDQKRRWLEPLLNGEIRSAFAMTEPGVASSDATNIRTEIRRDGDDYVINGRKWWTSGAGDPRCKLLITMGLSDPDAPERHRRQSMILIPRDAPGVSIIRYLPILGFSDSPHGHMETVFENVRVPAENMLLGEGRGFEIAQGRLGPGRIHHCMRQIGMAERALERVIRRLSERSAFGKPIIERSVWRQRIAAARCSLEQARLLTLKAAYMMDTVGNKAAQAEISMIKIVVPKMAADVVDMAMQGYGGAGFSDTQLAFSFIWARTTRVADGPDEVHAEQLARREIGRVLGTDPRRTGGDAASFVAQGCVADAPTTIVA